MKLTIEIDDRVGDKILVMSSSQYVQYLAAPQAFIAWLERTGKLPEPAPKKKPVQAVKERVTRKRK
jgi:hypothetical protein